MDPLLPRLTTSDADILHCFPVLRELRPALTQETFVATIREQQSEGYRLALLEDEGRVTTVAGFRVQRLLATGKTIW